MEPVNYKKLTWQERKEVREAYVKEQNGLCYHCRKPLSEPAVWVKKINQKLFPPSFFQYPVHLHHCHVTNMTIGAVHNYCNAELWQYHGE